MKELSDFKVVGIGNISVSYVDDKIFISNTNLVSHGVPTSIAVYKTTEGILTSSEDKLTWDHQTSTLAATHILATKMSSANIINTNGIKSHHIRAAYLNAKCIHSYNIKSSGTTKVNRIAFHNSDNLNPSAFLHIHKDNLTLSIKENSNIVLEFDYSNRMTLNGMLNIKSGDRNILPKGLQGDQKGDILINNNYIYYCTADYTGKQNIWVRWVVTETDWEN